MKKLLGTAVHKREFKPSHWTPPKCKFDHVAALIIIFQVTSFCPPLTQRSPSPLTSQHALYTRLLIKLPVGHFLDIPPFLSFQ